MNKYIIKKTESMIKNIITLHSGPLTCKQHFYVTTGRVLGYYYNHYTYCYRFIQHKVA